MFDRRRIRGRVKRWLGAPINPIVREARCRAAWRRDNKFFEITESDTNPAEPDFLSSRKCVTMVTTLGQASWSFVKHHTFKLGFIDACTAEVRDDQSSRNAP
jgi:hypothetical protein